MGKLATKIKSLNDSVKPIRHEIPELGEDGKPLVVYLHPLTVAQKSKIMPLVRKDDLSYVVKSVIMSARDEDGTPSFDLEDEKAMMRTKNDDWIAKAYLKINSNKSTIDELGEP